MGAAKSVLGSAGLAAEGPAVLGEEKARATASLLLSSPVKSHLCACFKCHGLNRLGRVCTCMRCVWM